MSEHTNKDLSKAKKTEVTGLDDKSHKNSSSNKREAKSKRKPVKEINSVTASVFTGLFLIIAGILALIYNFSSPEFGQLIFLWGMLVLGTYLIVFSLLRCMKRTSFIFGVLLWALGLGQLTRYLTDISASNIEKFMWPVIMLVISLSIIAYALLFRRESKQFKSYIIVGVVFVCFSALVFLAIFNLFDLSVILQKIWPIFLVLLGLLYIQRRAMRIKKDKNIQELEHENGTEEV